MGQHRRGRSTGSIASGFRPQPKDEDLALFHEMRSRECDDFLHPSRDDIEASLSAKFGGISRCRIATSLQDQEDKNDYDWLLTPPDTPLFTSLEDVPPEQARKYGGGRGGSSSSSKAVSKASSVRPARGTSPNRPSSPSGQRNALSTSSPSRPSSSSRPSSPRPSHPSSPTAVARPSTPTQTRRPSSPTQTRRPSTPTRRALTTSTSFAGNSNPKRNARSSSPSGKWTNLVHPAMASLSAEPPPNLRTSIDRPASNPRGTSLSPRPANRSAALQHLETVEFGGRNRRPVSPSLSRSSSTSSSKSGSVISSQSSGVEVNRPANLKLSTKSIGQELKSPAKSRSLKSPISAKKTYDNSSSPRSVDFRRTSTGGGFRPLMSNTHISSFYHRASLSLQQRSVQAAMSSSFNSTDRESDHDDDAISKSEDFRDKDSDSIEFINKQELSDIDMAETGEEAHFLQPPADWESQILFERPRPVLSEGASKPLEDAEATNEGESSSYSQQEGGSIVKGCTIMEAKEGGCPLQYAYAGKPVEAQVKAEDRDEDGRLEQRESSSYEGNDAEAVIEPEVHQQELEPTVVENRDGCLAQPQLHSYEEAKVESRGDDSTCRIAHSDDKVECQAGAVITGECRNSESHAILESCQGQAEMNLGGGNSPTQSYSDNNRNDDRSSYQYEAGTIEHSADGQGNADDALDSQTEPAPSKRPSEGDDGSIGDRKDGNNHPDRNASGDDSLDDPSGAYLFDNGHGITAGDSTLETECIQAQDPLGHDSVKILSQTSVHRTDSIQSGDKDRDSGSIQKQEEIHYQDEALKNVTSLIDFIIDKVLGFTEGRQEGLQSSSNSDLPSKPAKPSEVSVGDNKSEFVSGLLSPKYSSSLMEVYQFDQLLQSKVSEVEMLSSPENKELTTGKDASCSGSVQARADTARGSRLLKPTPRDTVKQCSPYGWKKDYSSKGSSSSFFSIQMNSSRGGGSVSSRPFSTEDSHSSVETPRSFVDEDDRKSDDYVDYYIVEPGICKPGNDAGEESSTRREAAKEPEDCDIPATCSFEPEADGYVDYYIDELASHAVATKEEMELSSASADPPCAVAASCGNGDLPAGGGSQTPSVDTSVTVQTKKPSSLHQGNLAAVGDDDEFDSMVECWKQQEEACLALECENAPVVPQEQRDTEDPSYTLCNSIVQEMMQEAAALGDEERQNPNAAASNPASNVEYLPNGSANTEEKSSSWKPQQEMAVRRTLAYLQKETRERAAALESAGSDHDHIISEHHFIDWSGATPTRNNKQQRRAMAAKCSCTIL